MKQILVYADSLSWGIIPNTRRRLIFFERWPGVMEQCLNKHALSIRVIENCLNGRRTVWEDPFKPGRNGLQGLEQVIEMHSPLALVILMLGTNDFQSMHQNNAWHSAQGIRALITSIRRAPAEPEMPTPNILVVAPPPIDSPKGPIAPKFEGGEAKCKGLAEQYELVAKELNCFYFNASEITSSSKIDGIHLDREQHEILGQCIATRVEHILKIN